MSLIFENRITTNKTAFINKVVSICMSLKIDPNWLMMVMNFESGLDPQKVNPYSGAVGLIQFMPDTAKALGTSLEALKKMSNVQQLSYVYKYLLPFRNKLKYFIDLYFAVFFPLAINKPAEWVFQTSKLSRSLIAKQNPVFDLNKDSKITVGEVQEFMFNKVPSGFKDLFKKKA